MKTFINMNTARKLSVLTLFMFLFTIGCKKDRNQVIPYVFVDISLYLAEPTNFNLNFVGGYNYVNGGSRGIVVYRLNQDQFLAFDRHCTHNIDDVCGQVSVDSSAFFLMDTCCTSKFIITNGTVYSGPATTPLQQYRTSFNQNILRIFN